MIYTEKDHSQQQQHEIVQIEYFNQKVHSVVTTDPASPLQVYDTWDFDLWGNDELDRMFYNSGSGGCRKDGWIIEIHSVTPNCQLWIEPKFRSSITNMTLINVELIDQPILLLHDTENASANPFDVARGVGKITYCQKCELFYDEDFCPVHDLEFIEGYEQEWAERKKENEDQP